MKLLRIIVIIVVSVLFETSKAQDLVNAPDSVFFEYAKTLRTKGNNYYLLSNKTGIRQVIDEYKSALEKRKDSGKLSSDMEAYFMQDIWKLEGDYHYENSDLDPHSYAEAEKYFTKYRDYYRDHQGSYVAGQGLYVAHLELAQLYYKQGKYEKALAEMNEAVSYASTYMSDEDDLFDKISQYAMCLARVNQFEEAIEKINEVIDNYENNDTERYGEALRKKAKIQMLREESGRDGSQMEALKCYKTYFGLKKKDALSHFMRMTSGEREQYWMRIRPFVTDCYRLEGADASFLYDVTLFAKGLLLQLDSAGGGRQNINATWQMIQQRLKPDDCAIEFVQYEKYGSQQMGALVLKKTGKPIFVKMAAPDSVMQYKIEIKGEGKTVEELIHSIHGADFSSRLLRNKLYTDSTGLNGYIWNSSLIKAIGRSRDVWFAPDGYSHRLAIEYLLPRELSAVTCHRVSSTRCLLEKQKKSSNHNALIVGGVNYQSDNSVTQIGNDSVAYNYLLRQGGTFTYLPSSKAEAESIFSLRHNPQDSILTDAFASEKTFRELCSHYSIIHISTHGYFGAAAIPQGTDLKSCMSDQSLSESILAFSGLQHNLSDAGFNHNRQDGIMSAKEISSLNLSETALVILSCCETGLGYVTADGVYGIQRGLKNAGVKTIICTLWDIDDEASCFFMTSLHRYMSEGLPVSKAFYKARSDMRDYSDEEDEAQSVTFNASTMSQQQLNVAGSDFSEPSFRDAFILIDAID